eukprot:4358610-Prymnesium_polylepis.1
MYDNYTRLLNKFELQLAQRLLKAHPAECRERVVFVDTHLLTSHFPHCTRGHGDGRHYVQLQGELWQLFANAYSSWLTRFRAQK